MEEKTILDKLKGRNYYWNVCEIHIKKQKLMEIVNRIPVRYKYTFKVKASIAFYIYALSFEHM